MCILLQIHLHGTDLSALHALITPKILPIEYGGTAGNFNNKEWYMNLLADEDYYKNQLKYGYKTVEIQKELDC